MHGPAGAVETLLISMGYGPLRRQGANLVGYCQVHGEVAGESRPSFSVRSDNGVYQCFSCGARGVLGKLAAAGGFRLPPDLLEQFRQAAQERVEEQRLNPTAARFLGWTAGRPLPDSFLYALDRDGPGVQQLVQAGYPADFLYDLGIRWDSVKRRTIYPLRDCGGRLVCLIGRGMAGVDNKYQVYKAEIGEMCQAWAVDYPFKDYAPESREYLWLMHEEMPPPDCAPADAPLLVVEGYKVAMWSLLAGVPRGSVCAIQGNVPTQSQIIQLERTGRPIVLALDNDDAGRRGVTATIDRIGVPVNVFRYPDRRKQLDDIPLAELSELLAPYMRPTPHPAVCMEEAELETLYRPESAQLPPVLKALRERGSV